MESYVDIANGRRVRAKRRPRRFERLWKARELAPQDVGDAYVGWRNALPGTDRGARGRAGNIPL